MDPSISRATFGEFEVTHPTQASGADVGGLASWGGGVRGVWESSVAARNAVLSACFETCDPRGESAVSCIDTQTPAGEDGPSTGEC
jgi:hypothetical protein